jgi:hypothetical protein
MTLASALRAIFGDVEVSIGGWFCDTCRDTHPCGTRCCEICGELHGALETCPHELTGFCANCDKRRVLDRTGNCLHCKGRSVTERRFAKRGGRS